METIVIPGHLSVGGTLNAGALTVPAGSISNSHVAAGAAIDATKLSAQQSRGHAQPNTAATTETRTVHVAKGAGTVASFSAGSIAKAVGDSTVTVDLRKNGASILSAVITLDSGNTNRVAEAATVSAAAYVAGDWFEIVITATVGTGTLPTGVYAQGEFRELPT